MLAGGSLQLQANNTHAVLGQITFAQLVYFENFLLNHGRRPLNYRTIKDDQDFRIFYGYGLRPVTFMDKDTGVETPRVEPSMRGSDSLQTGDYRTL